MASTNGDIYSYGILVLEMVTGKRPTGSIFTQRTSLREYVAQAVHNRTSDVIDTRLYLRQNDELYDAGDALFERNIDGLISLLRLGLSCSEEVPSSRMPAEDIIKELLAIKEVIL